MEVQTGDERPKGTGQRDTQTVLTGFDEHRKPPTPVTAFFCPHCACKECEAVRDGKARHGFAEAP